MTEYVVIDSSVAIKWFKHQDENLVPEAFHLLEQHRDERLTLVAPTLLMLEVLNALRCHGADASRLADIAYDLGDFGITWQKADPVFASEAARIAVECGLTVYDAAFVALAQRLDALLVTDDRQLLACGACKVSRPGS